MLARVLTALFYPLMRDIPLRLIPKNQLAFLGEQGWASQGNDPQFLVRSPLLKMFTGWVSISVEMDSEKILTPKVYLDFGDGFSEKRTITLYQTGADTYRAEIVLPGALKAMRFDPADEVCEFSVRNIRVSAHSEVLHIIRQFASIAKHDHAVGQEVLRIFKKSYARMKKHGMNGMLERLDKEYKRIHPYRIQRTTSQHVAYMNWIRKHEQGIHNAFDVDATPFSPLISVVMPVYNTDPVFLEEAIESVVAQSYPNWELCIADDASSRQETIHVLNKYREKYENIYVYFREHNGHISKATNTAIGLARGEYVAFFDHDDRLAPHALSEVVKLLNKQPELKLIYSDEDKSDEEGDRYDPHFKSGWNRDMIFSQNYISHLTVMKREVVGKLGGLRNGVEGAQDHDLLLRSLYYIRDEEIGHIEKVLYHWRSSAGSTAKSADEKSYTTRAGVKALQEYFDDANPGVIVLEGLLPNTYHPLYPIPGMAASERIRPYIDDSQINQEIYQRLSANDQRLPTNDGSPLVSLIIPTRDGYNHLHACIGSILEKTVYPNYEIIVVDNQSSDEKTLEYLALLQEQYANITILKYDRPFNYSAINNFAVFHAKGKIVGLINDDIEVITSGWMSEMVQHVLRPEIGAVGAKLRYDDGTIQHGGVVLGIGGIAGHSHKYFDGSHNGYFSRLKIVQNYSAVTGACLLVRKSLYEEVGGLDEGNLTVAFNDIDFSLKLLDKGYRNLWTPYAELYHHESKSRGNDDNEEKKRRFDGEVLHMQRKWKNMLQHDRYYNVHLSRTHENFQLTVVDR